MVVQFKKLIKKKICLLTFTDEQRPICLHKDSGCNFSSNNLTISGVYSWIKSSHSDFIELGKKLQTFSNASSISFYEKIIRV